MSYQQVPNDGTTWVFDDSMILPEPEDSIGIWNDIQSKTSLKVDDEIRLFREKIQNLLTDQRMQSEALLGVKSPQHFQQYHNSPSYNEGEYVPNNTFNSDRTMHDSECSLVNSDNVDTFSDRSLLSAQQFDSSQEAKKQQYVMRITAAALKIHNALMS